MFLKSCSTGKPDWYINEISINAHTHKTYKYNFHNRHLNVIPIEFVDITDHTLGSPLDLGEVLWTGDDITPLNTT